MLVFFVVFCYLGPLVYHGPLSSNLESTNLPPGAGHPLGTDNQGFDVLGELMKGGQASLEIGFLAAAIAIVVGALVGAIAGLAGGIIDSILMRIVDVFLSIPALFLLVALVSIFHASEPLIIVVIAAISRACSAGRPGSVTVPAAPGVACLLRRGPVSSATSDQAYAAVTPRLISVSMVATPCRAFAMAAQWNAASRRPISSGEAAAPPT